MMPERRINDKPRRKCDAHPKCLMKEEWATLHEHLFNLEESFGKYIISQNEINTAQNLIITKISNKIYGNSQNGMDTAIKLNKQTASSETAAVAESMKRLWWAMGVIAVALVGNLMKSILFGD